MADVNAINTKSVKLTSVRLIPATHGFNGQKLGDTQVRFVAKYKVKMGREEIKTRTLYLESDMNLAPTHSIWSRTSSPQHHNGVTKDKRYKPGKDPLGLLSID